MKIYKVYKNNYVYRVAAPTWWSWRWVRCKDLLKSNPYYKLTDIFQTSSYGDALNVMRVANVTEQTKRLYKKVKWVEVKSEDVA